MGQNRELQPATGNVIFHSGNEFRRICIQFAERIIENDVGHVIGADTRRATNVATNIEVTQVQKHIRPEDRNVIDKIDRLNGGDNEVQLRIIDRKKLHQVHEAH